MGKLIEQTHRVGVLGYVRGYKEKTCWYDPETKELVDSHTTQYIDIVRDDTEYEGEGNDDSFDENSPFEIVEEQMRDLRRIICISNDDNYEAVYVDGDLYSEGNPVHEGNERVIYFLKLCEEIGTDISLIAFGYISNDYLEYEVFPNNINIIYENIEWEN